MKKRLVVGIIGAVMFCMSGCASNGDSGSAVLDTSAVEVSADDVSDVSTLSKNAVEDDQEGTTAVAGSLDRILKFTEAERPAGPDINQTAFDAFLHNELQGQKNYQDYVNEDEVYGYSFLDVDNDGEKELALFSIYYNPMAFFDVHDGKVERICGGEGTAQQLRISQIDGKNVLCYYDTMHTGRSLYYLVRIDHNGGQYDQQRLEAIYDNKDRYDASDKFLFNDQPITLDEFEKLRQELVYDPEVYVGSYVERELEDGDSFIIDGRKYSFYAESTDVNPHTTFKFICEGREKTLTEDSLYHYSAYVVKAIDGKHYLWIATSHDSDDYSFYTFDLEKFGSSEFKQADHGYVMYRDENNSSRVGLYRGTDILGTGSIEGSFYAGKDGQPVLDGYMYYSRFEYNSDGLTGTGDVVTLKKDMVAPVGRNRYASSADFVETTLPKGTDLVKYRTDGESFVDLMMKDGRIVRFNMTKDKDEYGYSIYRIINGKYTIDDLDGRIGFAG
ncbi:hypothetical protein [Butyrivibrio sp. VCB2006]|uniref:hypothetical protein n=1 Tax=Butyrivibrio sp. VCB2006 TaxID=1280679 RepID=UPI00041CABB8|nr:hypothetical protein [Butyrivibrio sp. VCB2006]